MLNKDYVKNKLRVAAIKQGHSRSDILPFINKRD
jgi:hypothetical protein